MGTNDPKKPGPRGESSGVSGVSGARSGSVSGVSGARPGASSKAGTKPAPGKTAAPKPAAPKTAPAPPVQAQHRRMKVEAALAGDDEFSVFSVSDEGRAKKEVELAPEDTGQPESTDASGGEGFLWRTIRKVFGDR
jgi:hypothetical protein